MKTASATVISTHPPLARVRGFTSLQLGEAVEFENGDEGYVLGFQEDQADVLVLSSTIPKVGSRAQLLSRPIMMSVGTHQLGSVISPLGESLFGTKSASSDEFRELDILPPSVGERKRISAPLTTGVTLVDLTLPLAKGQRQLIVGDQKTGKTSFLLQAVQAQVQDDTLIVYAAIGKKSSEIKHIFDSFVELGIQHRTTLVATRASDAPSSIILTPFAAMTLAEHWRDNGKDVLVIFDDLTTHAKYYREVALLTKQFPGRDSYPGDIFYLHARLLERAGNFRSLTRHHGEVSITALPVAETMESDLTDFIVSNLISITDGHLLFDSTLFRQGRRPAIHTELSVTRVGKQAQSPLEREIGRRLTTLLNQYQKTVSLSHFGAELSDEAQAVLTQGETILTFFQQASGTTLPRPVQKVFLGMIWSGWVDARSTPLTPLLNRFAKEYENELQFQRVLQDLVTAPTLKEFFATLEKNKKLLIGVWKA